jgi:exodeoxyribonuclease (lambda-induced)
MIVYTDPQGSPEWLENRRGVTTGSRAKDARDRLADKAEKVDKKTGEITPAVRGEPSAKQLLYALDVARERCGGLAAPVYVNAAMRFGTEQEPLARVAYEIQSGETVLEHGFFTTDDHVFGCSVDGLIGADGMIEIKTMVSSDTLFKAVVDGENDAYIDQILFGMWITGRKWCDLILWAPDLPVGQLTVRRIVRDDDAIEELESDMLVFSRRVADYERKLLKAIEPATQAAVEYRPQINQTGNTELPESLFD